MSPGPGVECTLREGTLRAWARAITSLCSIGGTDIHFQFTTEALSLVTHDSSITSHVTLTFNRPFFNSYSIEDSSENLECKVPAKCALKPFRSIRFMTKCASECKIQFSKDSDTLNVTLVTKFGAQIRYQLRLLSDAELIEIDCDVTSLPSIIACDAKFMLGTLANFHHHVKGSGDLTWKVAGSQVSLRNSVTDLVKKEGKVYTELNLGNVNFTEYNVTEDCQLTVPLRDFKTFVTFADTMKLPLTLRFLNESKPVMVLISAIHGIYEGKLILANKASEQSPLAQPLSIEAVLSAPSVSISQVSSVNGQRTAETSQVVNERPATRASQESSANERPATQTSQISSVNEQPGTQTSVSMLQTPGSPVFTRRRTRDTVETPSIPDRSHSPISNVPQVTDAGIPDDPDPPMFRAAIPDVSRLISDAAISYNPPTPPSDTVKSQNISKTRLNQNQISQSDSSIPARSQRQRPRVQSPVRPRSALLFPNAARTRTKILDEPILFVDDSDED